MARPRITMDDDHGRDLGNARAERALWGVSEVLVGVVQVKGRREGERSEREAGQGRGQPLANAGGARARVAGARGGCGGKLEACWRDADGEARRLACLGGPRWTGARWQGSDATATRPRAGFWPA